MSDLNLNFDTGAKSISVLGGDSSGPLNLGFKPDSSANATSPVKTVDISSPKLSVSDPNGMGMLIGKPGSDVMSPKSETSTKPEKSEPSVKEDFSFFKPSEPEKPAAPGGSSAPSVDPNEAIFMNKEQTEMAGYKPIHRLSPQEIKNEKIDLLYKFKKLEGQGIRTTMNYNMNSHLEDMRNEYIKLKKQREVDNSVKFQRKMLMACVTGLEFMNNRFDPFSVKLDGWSESVNENLNDYDEIFEELGDKYGGAGEMAPEIRLLFTLAGSAFMFHLSNTMFKSSIPGMDDVLRQNPELMKQFAQAAVGSMNGGPSMGAPPAMAPPQAPPQAVPNPLSMMMGMGGPKPQVNRTVSPARSDMDGPDGIDELITKMNLEPNKIPDLDTLSLMSGDTDKKSSKGITLNL
uniref:Uncharacterized protein n=1 Tax=viral metagenome TaxID=1070528 RepID=A0A6C0F8F4_9ZZZZ|tara:strand:- start:7751 stop:8959 length:1209 start_codon:yes stop_codon:yes gene_type:complete